MRTAWIQGLAGAKPGDFQLSRVCTGGRWRSCAKLRSFRISPTPGGVELAAVPIDPPAASGRPQARATGRAGGARTDGGAVAGVAQPATVWKC
jgi:hypothetical protein